MKLGIKELRDGLSKHLAEVREGRTITVTDHGAPFAKIIPLRRPSLLDQMIMEGQVRPARRAKRRARKPIEAKRTVSDLVSQQRG